MLQFLVETKPGALFELFMAPWLITFIRVVLGVSVDMLCKILLLGKVPPAHITDEPFKAHVESDKVPLEAKSGAELLATVLQSAHESALVALVLLALDHVVQHRFELLLLLARQVEVSCEVDVVCH
jgi:hypothetical protein